MKKTYTCDTVPIPDNIVDDLNFKPLSNYKLYNNNLYNPIERNKKYLLGENIMIIIILLSVLSFKIFDLNQTERVFLTSFIFFNFFVYLYQLSKVLFKYDLYSDCFIGWSYSTYDKNKHSNKFIHSITEILNEYSFVNVLPETDPYLEKIGEKNYFKNYPFSLRCIDNRKWEKSIIWLIKQTRFAIFDLRNGSSSYLDMEIEKAKNILGKENVYIISKINNESNVIVNDKVLKIASKKTDLYPLNVEDDDTNALWELHYSIVSKYKVSLKVVNKKREYLRKRKIIVLFSAASLLFAILLPIAYYLFIK
jgi:hypothetical protein